MAETIGPDRLRAKLQKLLGEPAAGIQFSEQLEGDGAAIFAHARKFWFEGIVSKHREHRSNVMSRIAY
jgi:ATP-dependent DNA ligase